MQALDYNEAVVKRCKYVCLKNKDVYSFGMMLFEMVTAKMPYAGMVYRRMYVCINKRGQMEEN